MRELHTTMQLTKTHDYAAYTLFAKGAPSLNAPNRSIRLNEYLVAIASRNTAARPSTMSIQRHFENGYADFCQHFRRLNPHLFSEFEIDPCAFTSTGRVQEKGWILTVVEVEPAELRFHYTNHSLWVKHRRAIDQHRPAPSEIMGSASSDSDVVKLAHPERAAATFVASLPPYRETLVVSTTNPALKDTIFKFGIPRDDGTGADRYEVQILADKTAIIEPVGLAQRQLIVSHDADPQRYVVEVTEIQ